MARSPAIRFLEVVWKNNCEVFSHSWRVINEAMYAALNLAIHTGFRFSKNDFTIIDEQYRIGYWGGNDRHMLGERFYSTACEGSHGCNRSAAIAFENWKHRKPFILDGVRFSIGHQFRWDLGDKTEWLTVTSFSQDGEHLVGSLRDYDRDENGHVRKTKVVRRVKITREDLKARNKKKKAKAA